MTFIIQLLGAPGSGKCTIAAVYMEPGRLNRYHSS